MKVAGLLLCAAIGGFASAAPPTVRIVPAYEGVARYIRALEDEPEVAPLDLYQKYVAGPYRDCYLTPSPLTFLRAPNYLAELERVIRSLRASHAEEIIRGALTRSAERLRGPETVEVCLSVLDPSNRTGREAMGGVTGWAGERIALEVYPRPGWLETLAYVVAHEYHHVVRLKRYADPAEVVDLLGGIINEGQADTFASQLYPDVTVSWTRPLPHREESERWAQMEPVLGSTDVAVIQRYLYGGNGLPQWTGFRVGFRIMGAFLERRPYLDAEAWSALDAEVILKASGYGAE